MARRSRLAILLALAPAAAAAQSLLPADVVLLRRIKYHIRDEFTRLPDYTCLETIQRSHSGAKGGLKPFDTVRVEVLYTGTQELFAAPGAHDFREDSPAAFGAGGMSNTGVFALDMRAIFVDDNAMSEYRGEEDLDGRRAARWDYRIPLMLSGFTIHLPGASGRVASKGSYWADPVSLDVLRLDVHADDIPPDLPLAGAFSTVRYARTRIGDRTVMLPQTSETTLKTTDGELSRNVIQFTHCRLFQAQSTASFEATGLPGAAVSGLPPSVDLESVLPGGLTIAVGLASSLTQDDPIGEQIEGRVLADVTLKGAIVVRQGAMVRGRLRTVQKITSPPGYYAVSLELTELEADGRARRFFADLQDFDRSGGVARAIGGYGATFGVEELPGIGSFFVKGDRFELPKGFRTVWRTRPLQ